MNSIDYSNLQKPGDKDTIKISSEDDLKKKRKNVYNNLTRKGFKIGRRYNREKGELQVEIVGYRSEIPSQESYKFDLSSDNNNLPDNNVNSLNCSVDLLSKEECTTLLKIALRALS